MFGPVPPELLAQVLVDVRAHFSPRDLGAVAEACFPELGLLSVGMTFPHAAGGPVHARAANLWRTSSWLVEEDEASVCPNERHRASIG